MQLDKWILSATNTLEEAGIKTSRLDVLVLAESLLGKDRSWLLAHPTDRIAISDVDRLNKFIVRRTTHYPLAYITNKAYFYNHVFYVDDHVLVPRPESEAIIDTLKALPANDKQTIIDVGTGSGALAITAKLLFPKSAVIGTDIDPHCLNIAAKNALSLKGNITFVQSDLLKSLSAGQLANSVLLANLPYVPTDFPINDSAGFEPRTAIFGGEDGLDLYLRLYEEISGLDLKPKHIITESLPTQHRALGSIAKKAGYTLRSTNEYTQLFNRQR